MPKFILLFCLQNQSDKSQILESNESAQNAMILGQFGIQGLKGLWGGGLEEEERGEREEKINGSEKKHGQKGKKQVKHPTQIATN